MLRASPSTSSATIIRGFLLEFANSRTGIIDWTLEIFFSLNKTNASWYSTLAPKKKIYILTALKRKYIY